MKIDISQNNRRLRVLLVLLVLSVIAAAAWGAGLKRELLARLVLHSEAPSPSTVEELVASYRDPIPFLDRLWKAGRVAHRQLAMEALKHWHLQAGSVDNRIETLLLAGSADADASVREIALGALAEKHSPLLANAARAQLTNSDPQIRLLGVQYLARLDPKQSLPTLIPLLDDSDLRVVATVEAALRRWTGIDYGVRIAHSIPKRREDGQESLEPADIATVKAGIAQRKSWWELHKSEFPLDTTDSALEPNTVTPESSTATDFALRDLSGRTVRLSDFRGKLVILNFWATWCTACLSEIPDLIELQKRHPHQLVVLGISLDGVPDEHGHADGHEAAPAPQESSPGQTNPSPEADHDTLSTGKLQAKVARVVKARSITYPVLLDPSNSVGSRFNGGELPTNVLIDSAGNVRRRFIGARPLKAWEAMVAEIAPQR
jgi:thiol-disulfide isomerase/thioredoxin